jgi:hypothetical protein
MRCQDDTSSGPFASTPMASGQQVRRAVYYAILLPIELGTLGSPDYHVNGYGFGDYNSQTGSGGQFDIRNRHTTQNNQPHWASAVTSFNLVTCRVNPQQRGKFSGVKKIALLPNVGMEAHLRSADHRAMRVKGSRHKGVFVQSLICCDYPHTDLEAQL